MTHRVGCDLRIPNRRKAQFNYPEKFSSGFSDIQNEEVFCTSEYANLAEDMVNCNDNLCVPIEKGNWERRLPIQMMDREALLAYCSLLEDLLVRCQHEESPSNDHWQHMKSSNTLKKRNNVESHRYKMKSAMADIQTVRAGSLRIPKKKLQKCNYCLERHIWGRIRCKGFQHRCRNCGIFNHTESACWFQVIEQEDHVEHLQKKASNANDSTSDSKYDEENLESKSQSDNKDPAEDNCIVDQDLANQKELQEFVNEDCCTTDPEYKDFKVMSHDPHLSNIDLTENGKVDPDINVIYKDREETQTDVEESKEKETKSDKSYAVALKSTDLFNSDYNPVGGILGFQGDEKPIGTVSYWSKIKDNSDREKETPSNKIVPDVDDLDNSIESKDFDVAQNRKFVNWILKGISAGSPKIFEDRYVQANIKKNGGIVYEKYMEKKVQLENEKRRDVGEAILSEKKRC